jgi:hypothetical protein
MVLSIGHVIPIPYGLSFTGIIPAVFWYEIATVSKYHFGVLARLVGWVMGKFVAIGSRQRRELLLQVTSVILSLSMLILTEYFITRYVLVQSLEFSRVPIFLPLSTTISLLGEAWRNEPITMLFWIISLGLAFAVPGGLYINKPYSESIQKEVK